MYAQAKRRAVCSTPRAGLSVVPVAFGIHQKKERPSAAAVVAAIEISPGQSCVSVRLFAGGAAFVPERTMTKRLLPFVFVFANIRTPNIGTSLRSHRNRLIGVLGAEGGSGKLVSNSPTTTLRDGRKGGPQHKCSGN